ncbi:MAG: class I SAM-dependent methyltransferase [Nitrospirota bacterium]|nr:class I SAM-dependent methyltransferase [Nitrospirota bacterium]
MTAVNQRLEHKGTVVDSKNDFDVIECEACGFKHIVPIPSCEELGLIYGEDYYRKEYPFYFEHQREDSEWWDNVFLKRYVLFECQLPPHRRRILDIGSGSGLFLKLGMQRGWETLGVEPSPPAAEQARQWGLSIVNEFLTEGNVHQLGQFDVVHMHEVLEHIPHPEEMLNLALRLLRPGGILCVVVPNDYNPLQQVLRTACGYQPWWLAPPHHINYFSVTSLAGLIGKTGFEVIHKTATFPMELFLLMGDNYVGNDQLGRAMHGKRKKLELSLWRAGYDALWEKVYDGLADVGVGREVVMYARRPQA